MAEERVGIYPGTFDPITNGHLDIIRRGAKLVDRLIVSVATNIGKGPLFSVEERLDMVRAEIVDLGLEGRVVAQSFDILLIEHAASVGAKVIIRGLRAVSDFEYEFQMVGMNARLNPDVETVFLMASDRHQFISSRFVKEIAMHGGEVRHFTSERVAARVKGKVREASAAS